MTLATEDRFESEDGLAIVYRAWRPQSAARAILVIVPGFNAHSGYYGWAADRLVGDGLSVYAIDLRGRGRSEGERYYVESFSDYVGDVARLIALAKSRDPGLPLFLLGHSAGGVVASLYALDRQSELQGLICESFAFELPAPDFALAVIKGLSHITPHVHILTLKNEDFTRDPILLKAMNEDPLIAGESQPMRTLAALVQADEKLKAGFAGLLLPLLILHGSEDRAAKPGGSRHFFESAGATDKTIKLYEGSFHDPLNDLDRETVILDIARWIELHVPGPA
ncbi:MAG: Lysophospholipase [Alphaproteobacteria bacterium]|nr:Lysophospholipase [Alphaproteobacteria bacterium]